MQFPDGRAVVVGAQRVQEVIEVAGSNHAIGVILNLAWGPNNFSPSLIWSWRTRSNSNWLGGRVTPPRGIWILILLSFYFFSNYHDIYLLLSFFLFLFWVVIYCSIFYWYGFCMCRLLLFFISIFFFKIALYNTGIQMQYRDTTQITVDFKSVEDLKTYSRS